MCVLCCIKTHSFPGGGLVAKRVQILCISSLWPLNFVNWKSVVDCIATCRRQTNVFRLNKQDARIWIISFSLYAVPERYRYSQQSKSVHANWKCCVILHSISCVTKQGRYTISQNDGNITFFWFSWFSRCLSWHIFKAIDNFTNFLVIWNDAVKTST